MSPHDSLEEERVQAKTNAELPKQERMSRSSGDPCGWSGVGGGGE